MHCQKSEKISGKMDEDENVINIIGRQVAKLRYQRGWTQEDFAAKLQRLGLKYDISRETIAKIELGLRRVPDKWLAGFQKVFRLPIIRFFPQETQDLDTKFAQRA